MNWMECNPQNDLNPQDNIGEKHNLLLKHFVANIDEISADSEKTTIFQVNSIARYSSVYWVYTDIKAAYIGAWFTANPFVALGAVAVSSVVDAAIDYYEVVN